MLYLDTRVRLNPLIKTWTCRNYPKSRSLVKLSIGLGGSILVIFKHVVIRLVKLIDISLSSWGFYMLF